MAEFTKYLLTTLLLVGFGFSNPHLGHHHDHEHEEETTTPDTSSSFKHNVWTHNTSIKKITGVDLKWDSSDPEWITMEMFSKTSGYLAVGFCEVWHGTMEGCDIVLGWVADNGTVVLVDYHADSNQAPIVDENQDYELLYGKQENYETRIGFRRKWITNDTYDTPLGLNPVQIIYAWHPMDPINSESASLHPHDKNTRGHTTEMTTMMTPQEAHQHQSSSSASNFIAVQLTIIIIGVFCNF